jgi:hypothetical protein
MIMIMIDRLKFKLFFLLFALLFANSCITLKQNSDVNDNSKIQDYHKNGIEEIKFDNADVNNFLKQINLEIPKKDSLNLYTDCPFCPTYRFDFVITEPDSFRILIGYLCEKNNDNIPLLEKNEFLEDDSYYIDLESMELPLGIYIIHIDDNKNSTLKKMVFTYPK